MILFCENRLCSELIRSLQNLEASLHAQRAAPTRTCFPCNGKLPKKNQKAAARTCKKLPVASFCASETAETGRIANGCEQGDHVSRRKGAKVRAACCPDRGMLSAVRKFLKGNGFILFACTKRTKSTPEVCGPLDSRNGSNRRSIQYLDRFSGFYQVTNFAETAISHRIDGNDLNRCELQA